MYKVFFVTFGCKVNQYETECIRADLISRGYVSADAPKNADIIIVNSCTVTSSGDSKSLYAVRKLRKDCPDSVIVLTGCLPQSAPETAGSIPEADIVTGTKNRRLLPSLIENFMNRRERIAAIEKYTRNDKFEELAKTGFSERTRAFVKIQDGCDQFCSYCMIPYARGHLRSKPINALKNEIRSLAESGHKEIVLVGINLAFYGIEYGLRLADAVELCCKMNGIERVRLGSLEPEMLTDDDLLRLSRCNGFCPQFHLSLQSGCAETLKRMNRKYTPDEYYDLVCRIRKIFPDASFTTDIMVGFPLETEEEFVESMRFAEKIGFSKIHVFQYSPRKGTPAASMEQVNDRIKAERADRMKALGSKLSRKYMKGLVGRTVPVLFERESSDEFHQGRAPDHTLIKIFRKNRKKSLRNFIFYVTIEEVHDDYCFGSLCASEELC